MRIPFERSTVLLKWEIVGEVQLPGVMDEEYVERTDGRGQTAALAKKFGQACDPPYTDVAVPHSPWFAATCAERMWRPCVYASTRPKRKTGGTASCHSRRKMLIRHP